MVYLMTNMVIMVSPATPPRAVSTTHIRKRKEMQMGQILAMMAQSLYKMQRTPPCAGYGEINEGHFAV